MLEQWSVENFQRERAILDQARLRQAERMADFVGALYAVDEGTCRRMVALAFGEAGGPQELVNALLAPAARRAGEDWETDAADFLKVTIALSRLQLLFREVCTIRPPPAPRDPARRMLLAPAPGNQHAFGLSVVEDAFRRDGWRVDGGVVDADQLLSLAASNHFRIIGLSIGAERDLQGLATLTTALRSRSRNPSVMLMAGGSVAARNPQELAAAGFDWVAPDGAAAVRQAAAFATTGIAARAPF